MMWYMKKGNDNDVAVSTRVRLARNLSGYPFEGRLSDEKAKEILDKVWAVFDGKPGWTYTDFASLPAVERASYAERHIVSPEFARKSGPCALISNEDASVYIMVLEEDHLRLQAITAGMDLTGAVNAVMETEKLLDDALDLAYSEKLGYLTHCPTNLGTGMRASVMLHLPAYTGAGGIRSLQNQLEKLGLTIRGMAGEGSAASGCLYQISNQVTLGITEEETITKLEDVIGQIIAKERELRGKLSRPSLDSLSDRVMRNMGVMMYANRIGSAELLSLYSDVRLGASLHLIDLPAEKLDEMLMRCMPNTICAEHEGVASPADRDRTRASVVKEILGKSNTGV
ncbi:MAG: ATP--guanido phosphotransferase [Eubacteriales bacterium]